MKDMGIKQIPRTENILLPNLMIAEIKVKDSMADQNSDNKIAIGVCSLKDLFTPDSEFVFKIPDYQRPYIWNKEKVETLFVDVNDFLQNCKADDVYYMGAILLHGKKDNSFDIIDGQQRITTLLILDHVINKETSLIKTQASRLQLFYNSPKSQANIISNEKYILNNKDQFFKNAEQINSLIEKLVFTVIVTKSEDDAFVFFDTQNNRGVKLSAVDFLKSFHLKALKGEKEETEKQKIAAKQWDKSNQNQFLDILFCTYLWRGRTWKGQNVDYENKDKVLEEFQKKTRKKRDDQKISLFPNSKNKLAASLEFSAKKGISICTNNISIQANPIDFPFSLRQPIEKGMNFFLFTEKYYSLYKFIFDEEHDFNTDLKKMNVFFNEVYVSSGFSLYLTHFFKLCVILYFDKFEQNKLFEFVLWLDYLLGSYRIKQKSIVAKTPIKIIRDEHQNLLDIIDNSFLPEEILEFIQKISHKEYYGIQISGNGVQGRYKRQLEIYFCNGRNSDLTEKDRWIYAKLNDK